MNISELNEGMTDVSVEAEVVSVGEVKEINKYGNTLKVANVEIKDDSGSIKLTLWNENIDKVKEGDKIKIEKGYVRSFQGELQLTLGKNGTLEVL
ncbi:DNA-binding protein [Candidatus Micrarchaeota archaeon]|nr:DNA-binding protein [Candidatus Micrarchaeota archaeon]